jgi:hypothetical protein
VICIAAGGEANNFAANRTHTMCTFCAHIHVEKTHATVHLPHGHKHCYNAVAPTESSTAAGDNACRPPNSTRAAEQHKGRRTAQGPQNSTKSRSFSRAAAASLPRGPPPNHNQTAPLQQPSCRIRTAPTTT